MKRAYLISPGLDIIQFVGNILLQEPEELSQNLVIFPGKRPGHFLRKYLAEKRAEPFVSPTILSMDEFVDFVYTRMLGHTDQLAGPIDGVAIIFNLNKGERLISNKESPFCLDEFLPWGFKLFADFEELCIEEIPPRKLKGLEEIAGATLPAKINENLVSLSRLYELFYKELGKLNLSTRSLRYQKVGQAIKNVDLGPFKRIFFVGLFGLTSSEKRMLSFLAQDDKALFIFQKGPGIDQTIKSLRLEVWEEDIEKEPPVINFYQAMDVHSEVFKLNQLISQKKSFDYKDVIVLPLADTLFPIVQHTLGFTDRNYNISMGYPLLRTPVYGLIQTLSELLETRDGKNYYVPAYLKFVLQPYVKNIYFKAASYATRIVFHTIEENLVQRQRRFVTLKELEEDKEIIKDCLKRLQRQEGIRIDQQKLINHLTTIHDILIKPFEEIKNIEDFADKSLNLFSFISENSPANLHPFTAPFIKTMLEAIYELKASALSQERFQQIGGYFKLLKNYVRTIRYPFAGTPVKGLQVLGFLETRNIKFDTVYFLDANEGVIPHTTKEDTLLPHAIRTCLGLPTYQAREEIFNYYFKTLLAGAKEIHLFYIEGADKEKSRFVEELIWERERATGEFNVAKSDIFFNLQFSQKEPMPIKKTSAMIQFIRNSVNFTATRLDNYLACPISFYYGHVLCLSHREELSGEPDALKLGGLVHNILERFFITKLGQPLRIEASDYETMDNIVEDIFAQAFSHWADGLGYLLKLQTKKRMKDVLDYHRNSKFAETIIIECEANKERIYQPKRNRSSSCRIHLTNGETVLLVGKLDRVDRNGDSYCIIDYKTGASADTPNIKTFDIVKREEWLRTLKSVQLVCYLIIYLSNNPGIKVEDINASLMLLGAKVISEKDLFPRKLSGLDRQRVYESYKRAVVLLIEEILNPAIPFMATKDTKLCAGCEFRIMCGRQWVEKRW